MKKSAITALILSAMASAALAMDQNVIYNDDSAQISGYINSQGNFRLNSIKDNAIRRFKVGGDLIGTDSNSEFKDNCESIYRRQITAFVNMPDSLILSGVVYPYTAMKMKSIVGHNVENPLEILSVDTAFTVGPNAMSAKAFNTGNLAAFTNFVNQRLGLSVDKIKKGGSVDLNFTNLGPLACDLFTGDAQMKIIVRVRHESAYPTVSSPISAKEISNLSKSLIANHKWAYSKEDNMILAGAKTIVELERENKSQTGWNSDTYLKVVKEVFDQNTFKPKLLEDDAAEISAKRLTISTYDNEAEVLTVQPIFTGVY